MPPGSPRVAYLTCDDLARHSGYVNRVRHVADVLADLGYGVRIFGFATAPAPFAADAVAAGTPFAKLRAILAALRYGEIVVLTSIGALHNGWTALLVRLLGKTLLYDCHDPVVEIQRYLHPDSTLLRAALRYVRFQESLVDRCARGTLVCGRVMTELMRARGWRGPAEIFYNYRPSPNADEAPVESATLPAGWGGSVVVAYAGGLQRVSRGLETQIAAVRAARLRGADVRLLLIGFGDGAYFEELGADLAREDAMRVMADVAPARLFALLRACDFAIASEPLRWGMNTKLFDYVRAGVRILSPDDGRDINGVFGDLLTRYDPTTDELTRLLCAPKNSVERIDAERARSFLARVHRESLDAARRLMTIADSSRRRAATTRDS